MPHTARRIDVHHHFLPQRYMKEEHERVALSHGLSANALLQWTPSRSLEVMDEHGIEFAIGSSSTPGPWFGDVAATRRLTREWNEAAANAVRDHPGRFGFFAMVAPPDLDGALAEIEHSLDRLHALGVGFLSNYDGKSLGDPAFAPIFAELDRRKAVVYVHPTMHPCCMGLVPGILPQTIEFPLDTTRTITSLAVSGTFARHPNIRFIFSHGGGTLPFLAERIGHVAGRNKDIAARNPNGIMAELKKLYCDTASAASGPQLAAMLSFYPKGHILFGSDYPFVTPHEAIGGLAAYPLPDSMRRAIDHENALALLPRIKI